jgi:prepilin-type N-terminal cleavage/methylation domain-containing protein
VQRRNRKLAGFTIVEVLVAIALFAIVVLVILVPITGLFGLTKRSTSQVSATNLAQQWVEQVKGQWQAPVAYNAACLTSLPPTNVAISIRDEDVQGNVVANPTPSTQPPAPADNPSYSVVACTVAGVAAPARAPIAPLRLVTVKATTPDNVVSVLKVEVAP